MSIVPSSGPSPALSRPRPPVDPVRAVEEHLDAHPDLLVTRTPASTPGGVAVVTVADVDGLADWLAACGGTIRRTPDDGIATWQLYTSLPPRADGSRVPVRVVTAAAEDVPVADEVLSAVVSAGPRVTAQGPLTAEQLAGIRARVEADYPTVCTGCGHGRLVHAIPAPSPCAVRGWLAPGWRCECPGWQHPYLPVGRHDGRQDRRDAIALLAEVARLAEVERQARADQADRHDDLAHALGRDDAAVGWDELISIAASAAQAESESQVRAKARADGTGLLHCETPARGDTITELGHQMACTPPVLPWAHRLDAREGLRAARDDLIGPLEDGGHLDARADRLLNAYRAAVLREGAEAVFALDYDDQVKGGEDIGSIREAWDLGTIHATELLGRLADAAADSTCGHDADDRCEDWCEDCGRCPCAVCATCRVCQCECACAPPTLARGRRMDDFARCPGAPGQPPEIHTTWGCSQCNPIQHTTIDDDGAPTTPTRPVLAYQDTNGNTLTITPVRDGHPTGEAGPAACLEIGHCCEPEVDPIPVRVRAGDVECVVSALRQAAGVTA